MPPKRLTNLPSNIFLEHIAPRLKTRNIARLNTATGRKVPGLTQEARNVNAERKRAAIAVVKKQQHALARRIITVMKGIRMAFRKKHSANATNRAWLNRYSHLYKFVEDEEFQPQVVSRFTFRGFGGLVIEISLIPEEEQLNSEWTFLYWPIKSNPLHKSRKFFVGIETNGIGQLNWRTLHSGHLPYLPLQSRKLSETVLRFYETILTPVMMTVISMWNALPAANRA